MHFCFRVESKTPSSNLPASSTYYHTSASKAKILSLVQEKVAEGEINPTPELTDEDENNHKKIELILSIRHKVNELQNVREVLKEEIKENEELGKELLNIVKQTCSTKEQEKYNLLVPDINHIINLLLSLSSRLARVENALAMLSSETSDEEKVRNKLFNITFLIDLFVSCFFIQNSISFNLINLFFHATQRYILGRSIQVTSFTLLFLVITSK